MARKDSFEEHPYRISKKGLLTWGSLPAEILRSASLAADPLLTKPASLLQDQTLKSPKISYEEEENQSRTQPPDVLTVSLTKAM